MNEKKKFPGILGVNWSMTFHKYNNDGWYMSIIVYLENGSSTLTIPISKEDYQFWISVVEFQNAKNKNTPEQR